MKLVIKHALLAIAAVGIAVPAASADELRFSELEQRLASIERQLAEQQGVQAASFETDYGHAAGCDCQQGGCFNPYCHEACCGHPCGAYYAEIQLNWFRVHVMEDFAGKLSEQYGFSPRVVLGYEDPCGVGARFRYWHYGYSTPILNGTGNARFEWDVFDVEGTGRLKWGRTDVLFGGGFRGASVDFEEFDGSLYGATFAIDARTRLCNYCNTAWSSVYGARFSVLGGDWSNVRFRDDNVNVKELYGGFEYRCCYSDYDLYSRIVFEMQYWHSDVLAQNAGTDSIGLIGPGWHIGATF
jgi:hypothetical protein